MKKTITLLLISVSSVLFSQVPNYVPTNGLVSYWPFNGNANDESGNGNNGTVNGNVILSSDRFGNSNQAYSFPGNSSSYIDVNNSMILQIQQSLSISVWLYMENGFFNPRIMTFGNGSNSGYGMSVAGTSNISRKLDALFTNVGGSGTGFCCGNQGTGIDIPSLSWQHVVFTVDSEGNSKLYHNSILMASANGVTVNNAVYTTNLNIGRLTHPSYDAWGGMLDDIGIWNRALTQQEITNLYNSTLSTEDFIINDLSFYPNPTSGELNFKASTNLTKIAVYNALGQLVQEEQVNGLEGSINIERLAQGTYIVKVNDLPKGYTVIKN